jgi:hypothetical protein
MVPTSFFNSACLSVDAATAMSSAPRFQKSATATPREFISRSVPAGRPISANVPSPLLRRCRLRSKPCHERLPKYFGSKNSPVL